MVKLFSLLLVTLQHKNRMIMKNIIYIFALGLALCSSAQAQRIYYSTENTTGKKDIVSVEVPEGWVQVHKEKPGVHANQVLVKADETALELNNGWMFIQTIPMDATQETVADIVAYEKMMNTTKTTKVEDLTPLVADKKNKEISWMKVTGSVDGAHQVVAFIPVKNALVTVTLCTPFAEFLADHMNDFQSMVKSYQLNPVINPPAFADLTID
jgi:hypothetical protein